MKVIQDCLSQDWPTSTDNLCQHCCHPIDGVPVPLPQSYDTLKKVYHCRGQFCSWQCVKAYNMRSTVPAGRGNRNMYIALLAHRTWVKVRKNVDDFERLRTYACTSINPAPPPESLRIFGGDKTIHEFRKGSFGIVHPEEATVDIPFATTRQRLSLGLDHNDDSRRVLGNRENSGVHNHSNSFCAKLDKARTDKSIMKRKKRDSDKNTLMSTMGVVVETRKKDKSNP
ncbi:putative VLTF2 transcription factor [Feldmannia species virus]|uniref:Putative VLTF2 transcription factor n=1 Tax=Feldmannia species virus TaxID=39420 RepID=B5LWB1_9PHYC|nr:putative VLTF2 transcription factor [Feldmannia species virus]ACH46774.1 putative VLTF2 transcription factor [Feldmannia species virus]